MSGIAAIIRFDGGEIEPGSIEKMTAAMEYRGPDGIALWARGPVALGHCMMRTTAESLEEVQPLCNEDNSLILVMDGWLSNWEELRSELLSQGVRLRTRSDAELALRAYELWGEDCPKHIDGEFAFVIWDQHRGEVYCARDHAGLRPLHYHWDGKRLVVASDIAGILAVPDVEKQPNGGMIAEYMTNEWLSHDETIWSGVLRVLPANWLAFGRNGTRGGRYWSPLTVTSIRYECDDDYFEHYRELFADCVRRASRTHLPLACEVSGGLDSSAIFAMAHLLRREGQLPAPAVKGYTLLFEEKGTDADEIAFARAVGDHVGEEISEVPPFLPDLSWFKSRGRADCDMAPYPNGAMTINLGQAAVANGSRVVLNGSGGDECLEGSPLYYAELLAAQNWPELYQTFRQDAVAVGWRRSTWWLFKYGFAQFLPSPLMRLNRRLVAKFFRNKINDSDWLPPELKRIWKRRRKDLDQQARSDHSWMGNRNVFLCLNESYAGIGRDHGARLCARIGYEPRSPMYSRHFIEFAFAIPERLLNRGGTTKYVHRMALAGLIPDLVATRNTKAEFSFTFTQHLDELAGFLTSESLQYGTGLLDQNSLAKLYARYRLYPRAGGLKWKLWGIFGCENAVGAKEHNC